MGDPIVTLDQGTLRGSTSTNLRGQVFFKFQGIPYAKAPLGQLRFKAPVPPEPWTGVLDATKEGQISYQRVPFQKGMVCGGENCLFLNVFTKKVPTDDPNPPLRPVMFWVHGGLFISGSGNEDLYGPEFLMTEDVVLVTINYRLGILGFVSFEDPSLEVPGNAGFKDQVMALQWVQTNISKFGGDPNNVTVFGESAGAISVHLLVLSPMTKGLFHKAIAQSGYALNASARRGCTLLAKTMGLEGVDDKIIYDTLMQKQVDEIFEIQERILKEMVPCQRRLFSYVVEKNSSNPFLDEEPITLMKTGRFNQVPFMLGFTSGEGMLFDMFSRTISDFESVVPWYFGYEPGHPDVKVVANQIKKFYFGDEDISPTTKAQKYDMLSDAHFIFGLYTTILSQYSNSKAPTYLFRMSVESRLNFLKNILKIEVPGACHLDDVGYLFKNFSTPKIEPDSLEDISISRFVKLWTNFAKFGNPTPDENDTLLKTVWKPVTNDNLDFLDIGRFLVARRNPYSDRIKFWKQLFAESPTGRKTLTP
ncbi:hypothetical protein Zmor_022765 [Zophobas morio]|nr:hypothetical protein Zmor_022765 [Zophobas morio]